jgi:hypothetical protein
MDPEEKDEEMAFQNAKKEVKAIYECRKVLHVMFVGS